eukprot:CAMPEP_0169273764 /NCGR_PEP_ID=MMETSP1016-20121227/51303_1 /TAXON_ID=342587 /ORGANISM="Karlodinium micrum, Strain CCMP2283" /LENGTH=245 /DNA_ID=CAMNT_0009360155 /DNA_START=41 /DNA_END=775 /DNA_ORIENTATION=-
MTDVEASSSSLVRTVLEEGDQKNYPKTGDELTMHYTGTLASNGSKFDSSVDRGRPFVFKIGIGMVIRGWDEGVMQMSLGEKAKLAISADYGYGAKGAGGVIPPNADLNFEALIARGMAAETWIAHQPGGKDEIDRLKLAAGASEESYYASLIDWKDAKEAKLAISADYGYGAKGAGGVIPPNADLNFEALIARGMAAETWIAHQPGGKDEIDRLKLAAGASEESYYASLIDWKDAKEAKLAISAD